MQVNSSDVTAALVSVLQKIGGSLTSTLGTSVFVHSTNLTLSALIQKFVALDSRGIGVHKTEEVRNTCSGMKIHFRLVSPYGFRMQSDDSVNLSSLLGMTN